MGKQPPSHAGATAARALRATYQMFFRAPAARQIGICGCTTAMKIRCARCREPLEPSPSQLNRAHIAEVAAKVKEGVGSSSPATASSRSWSRSSDNGPRPDAVDLLLDELQTADRIASFSPIRRRPAPTPT